MKPYLHSCFTMEAFTASISLHLTISFYSEEFKWSGFHESEDLLV